MITLARGGGRFLSKGLPWHWGPGFSPVHRPRAMTAVWSTRANMATAARASTPWAGARPASPRVSTASVFRFIGVTATEVMLWVSAPKAVIRFTAAQAISTPRRPCAGLGTFCLLAISPAPAIPSISHSPESLSSPNRSLNTMARDLAHAAGSPVYPYNVGYGPFTGALPYPESYFAPLHRSRGKRIIRRGQCSLSVRDRQCRSSSRSGDRRAAVVDVDGVRGMKVTRVYPGTAAEKAGLKPGDVIRSINGYRTEQPGNLAWIIVNAAPGKVLKINVRTAADGKEQTITAQLP